MIIYQNILQKLADAGWTSYRIKKEKQLSGGVIDRLREGRPITTETLDTVCRLCECQPGELLTWAPDSSEK